MTIAIIGNGWIGNRLSKYLDATIINKKIEEINEPLDFDVVINTAAKTNIDWCEKNKDLAYSINVLMAEKLARLTKGIFVHFSSACIFESKNINDIKYEDSVPNPQCYYAVTKMLAEERILKIKPNSIIIRPRLLISEFPHERNTINKLKKYSRIINSEESVTIVEDMLFLVKKILNSNLCGIFNVVNAGTISPAKIMSIYGTEFNIIDKKVLDDEMLKLGRAKRVSTIIGSKKIELLPNINDRIDDLIRNYKKNEKSNS